MDVPVINELYQDEIRTRLDMSDEDMYCFGEFMEVSASIYLKIAKTCFEKGIRKVYDIGCATPFQAKLFRYYGISYVGIDSVPLPFKGWSRDSGVDILVQRYPFPLKAEKNACIVSSFCLGYFAQGEATYKQMAADFDYFCGFIGMKREFDLFRQKFGVTAALGTELPLCFAECNAAENDSAVKELLAVYDKLANR